MTASVSSPSPSPYVFYGRLPTQTAEERRDQQLQEARELMGGEPDATWWDVGPRGRRQPGLEEAIREAQETENTLVIGRMGRLAGAGPFLSMVLRAKCPVRFLDLPNLPQGPASRHTVMALRDFAEAESRRISEATRRGLERARRNGRELGGDRGHSPSDDVIRAGAEAAAAQARARREELAPTVMEAYAGEGTYAGAARALNEAGAETLSGEGVWHPQTVKRVLEEVGVA